jgi:hypothetical protein
LDAIAPTTFTVSHPDMALVLKRRFAYAKSIANGERLVSRSVSEARSRISVKLPDVSALLGSCEFAARKRHGIIPILEAVSNGNIRRLLDFARAVLCSGHLDTKKILEIIQKDGSYIIPDFEGVKALLYGEYRHYYPVESPFINLFDVMHAHRMEHFLSLCSLHYLSRTTVEGPSRGYVPRRELTAYLSGQGFSLQASNEALTKLLNKNLIMPDILPGDGGVDHTRYRMSSLGAFHLHYLCHLFQYLDAMTIDTPILDEEFRKLLIDTESIHERIERTKLFLKYLDGSLSDIRDEAFIGFWMEQCEEARTGIHEIEMRIGFRR